MMDLMDAISKGQPVSPLGARMYMYGIYLAHGGRPDDYFEMDEDDLDMMYVAYNATEAHRHNRWLEAMSKIVKAFIGQGD